jgi:hypothetical protein
MINNILNQHVQVLPYDYNQKVLRSRKNISKHTAKLAKCINRKLHQEELIIQQIKLELPGNAY